jgi:GGDEF domain-containing protein
MGASIYPNHGEQLEDLFRAADEALYQVKGTDARYKIFSNNQISWLED